MAASAIVGCLLEGGTPEQALAHAASTPRYPSWVGRRGTQKAIVAIGHKRLKVVFVLLSRHVPDRDATVDYEALLVKRNAPRWIRQRKKYRHLSPKVA